MGLLFLLVSYAALYHIGCLLMRLVVVQPVGDSSVVRWCFASTFALSLSLFSAVLADMAHVSLSASTQSSTLQRVQQWAEVDARAFTVVLLCLLATVLLACPGVVALSFLHSIVSRGGGGGRRAGRRGCAASRRASSTASGRRRSGSGSSSRRGSLSSTEFAFSERKRSLRCGCLCGLRWWAMLLVLLCIVAAGVWAARTGRLDARGVGQRVAGVGRAVYHRLQTRTALFRVPEEIQSARPAEPGAAKVADGETDAREEAWAFPFPPSAALMPMDLPGVVRAVTSRVAVVGVAMIGLLAGYAAITTPFLFLAPYTYWRGREEELRRAQSNFTKKLCYVLKSYGNAQRLIASLQYGVLHEEWATPAFSGSAPSSNTHAVPPTFNLPALNGAEGEGGSVDEAVESTNDLLFHPLPQEQQFTESAPLSASLYPPPPRRPGSSRPLDDAAPPTTSKSAAVAKGPVSWLQRTLTTAATVVTGGVMGRSLGAPATPGSTVISAAAFRQRAVARITKLREEAKNARYLSLSLYLQLNEVEAMVRDAERGGTWAGRWYAGLGVAMALYSFIKVVLTGASLWYFKASTQDPVTRAVTLLENAFILRRRDRLSSPSFSVTAVEVSTHVILALALLVNGWMVLSSIRGALLALFHVTMSFSGSAISRPETIAAGLSMLIGVYFVGQLVLLRSSLPASGSWDPNAQDPSAAPVEPGPAEANVLLQVLGMLPYYYYQRLNDWCFMVGCLGGVVVRRFVMRDVLSSVMLTASGGEER